MVERGESKEKRKHVASHLNLSEGPPDKEDIQELTEAMKEPPPLDQEGDNISVLVFRLGKEWLALSTIYFKEITHRRPVQHVPHLSGKIFQGVVNLNGKLELYVNLRELLQIEIPNVPYPSPLPYQRDRLVAIVKEGELWVFPVDEIDGIHRWHLLGIENVPVNISQSTINYIKGIMKMENKSIGLLDEELLFSSLKRSL